MGSGSDNERPSEHGGGEAGPPIAGDPSTFPSDAELARTLTSQHTRATLCTLTEDGYPYGSAVSYAAVENGEPVVLVSNMAEHTVNAKSDDRVSILIASPTPDDGDPLSASRLTLVGRLQLLDQPGPARDSYLAAHPYAAYYADFTDFGFWQLQVERCRFIGGFGHMSWVTADSFRSASPDPVASTAAEICAHMNEDHSDANLLYAQNLAGLDDATEARMVNVDRHGVTLQVVTPAAPRMARLGFDTPLSEADEARPAVITLLKKARQVGTD